jgi:molybdenum cofactor synthesis domain-containing protein
MTGPVVESAAALLIGNELLSGKVHEANLIELARTLRAIGIRLSRVVMIPDDVDVIAKEVRNLAADHDVVFTSGGVGPTHDDVTIEGISRGFGVAAVIDEKLRGLLASAYGDKLTDGHLRMALKPEGAMLMEGSDVKWPTIVHENVWILPGVPEIFRMKLAVVREHLRGQEPFYSRAVFTRLDEAALKPLLDAVVSEYPEVDVGSYPKWFDESYKTKVTFDARNTDRVDAACAAFVAQLPEGAVVREE